MVRRFARLLALLSLATPALASEPTLLQPVTGERGLVVEAAPSRAALLRPNGQRLRLPLRRGEEIQEIVEFAGGWAAAAGRVLGGRREMAVIVDGAAGVERLRPVPDQAADLRVRPVPLASASGFEGLAWLEGDSPTGYAVRAARWTGAGWDPPTTVSPARRGGQAGLVGTVLADGRWLLVWSALDGGASALFWATGDGARWSAPRRLAGPDRAPDVTPTLIRAPGGALLVWARRQGAGFDLRGARLTDRWSPPRPLGAGWSPRFAELAEAGRFLLHRAPGGWAAIEIDGDLRARRRAEIPGASREPPVLTAVGDGVAARWRRGERVRPLRWESGHVGTTP